MPTKCNFSIDQEKSFKKFERAELFSEHTNTLSIWRGPFCQPHYVYFNKNRQKTNAIRVVKDELRLYDDKYMYFFFQQIKENKKKDRTSSCKKKNINNETLPSQVGDCKVFFLLTNNSSILLQIW